MKTVNIGEAKKNFPSLLRLVEKKGKHFHIVRNGKPIAELRPIQEERTELVDNAMAPLDPEDWPGLD